MNEARVLRGTLLKSTESAFLSTQGATLFARTKELSYANREREREGTFSLCYGVCVFEGGVRGKESFSGVFSSTDNDGLINGLATSRCRVSFSVFLPLKNDGYTVENGTIYHISHASMKDSVAVVSER